MASPVAHALVGLGCAAAAARATGTPDSQALWLGAVIASGLPDLDFIGSIFGLPIRRIHRHATHSLLVLTGFIFVAMLVWSMLSSGIDTGLALAWSVALLSHPLLDMVTTGPAHAARGVGIPLLWPVLSRRWFLQRPLLASPDLVAYRSLRRAGEGLLRELKVLAPAAFVLVLLHYVF